MDITYQYMKFRSACGRQPLFCEQGPDMCDSIAVDHNEHKQYILRNPVHQLTQNTRTFSQCEINTIRAEYASSGVNHSEGGWPKDVHIHDPEATQRYRRRIEKEEGYIHCVMAACPQMEHYVLQNNAIDMYRTYYTEMSAAGEVERAACRTVNVYRDTKAWYSPKRPINSISWQPEGGHRIAVTYLNIDFNRQPLSVYDSFIWDIENNTAPQATIQTPCGLLDLQFNPRDVNVLAGGLISGQVAAWDERSGSAPVAICPPHVAHRDLVRNVLFISAKSGQEFFSGGPDGVCKWWDMRNMDEPTDEMVMDAVKTNFDVQTMPNANGICSMEYESTLPTRFMVGTENGLVLGANRKGKTPMEKIPARFTAHDGSVWAVERNPNFMKNFLTVGDWTMRVWSEDCRESSILMSPPQRYKLTHGTWSPTRGSLILLTQSDGGLALWDLMRRQHEPILCMHVCDEPLLRVRMHDAGTLVACGNSTGNIYLVELSHSLASSTRSEKSMMALLLERESKRERILEARLREIRLKLRQAEEGSPAHSATDLDATIGDKDLAEATAEYNACAKKEMAAM